MSDFVLFLIVIGCFLSIVEFVAMCVLLDAGYYDDKIKYMCCPTIMWSDDIADNHNLNAVGKWILRIGLTALSIVALVVWYVSILTCIVVYTLWKWFIWIFKKRDKKLKDELNDIAEMTDMTTNDY